MAKRVGAVGLDAFVLIIPVARADDVIGHAQRRELPMQTVAKGPGLVAGNDLPALGDLLFAPTPENPSGLKRWGGLGLLPSYCMATTCSSRCTSSASLSTRKARVEVQLPVARRQPPA